MPARKSTASAADEDPGLSVEDLNLPKTMVNRLAKGALPPNFNVQSVAQSAVSKSATVFVNYLTAHASDIAARQNKKTIQPKDVLDALKELEFDMFIDRTNNELNKYQEIQCTKRNTYRRRVKDEKRAAESNNPHGDDSTMSLADTGPSAGAGAGAAGGGGASAAALATALATATANGETHDGDENGERAAKKARVDANGDHDMDDDVGEDEGEEEEEEEEEEEDEGEDEEDEEEGDEDEEGEGKGDQEDLLEEKAAREDEDEALDGEESD
ncbi:cbf nf-y family transcription factor protein [Diplodia corticola]|uniref:DNA polymerase epsilon subunit D n=1 Tax=Diplodia corticola TaxID=236234 RepID=A0A1J9SFR5_9PEZI|nr:cbf nf-y family transcription factor protein [Diplodia corticola]OJD38652.1 cbf nf-y family transcription factor protein [Diplodia corticola]